MLNLAPGRITALAELAADVQRSRTLESRLQLLVERTAELLRVERMGVRLIDPVRRRLLAVARAGAPLHRGPMVDFELGEGLIGWVVSQSTPVRSGDAERDPRFVRRAGQSEPLGSFVGVPLRRGDGCIGVLYGSHRERDRFSESDQHVLTLVAGLCAPHIETARLERLADLDALTGTLNRRGARPVLEGEQAVGVSLCDLDHFKALNDEHGHATGDVVLCRVATILGNMVRAGDSLVRWGGEEFLIVLPGASIDAALAVAERARRAVAAEPFGEPLVHVTLSAGVAVRRAGESVDQLLRRADAALYQAKRGGRNQSRAG
jgi:diguanylate cyclase (GGDEF)-like protein